MADLHVKEIIRTMLSYEDKQVTTNDRVTTTHTLKETMDLDLDQDALSFGLNKELENSHVSRTSSAKVEDTFKAFRSEIGMSDQQMLLLQESNKEDVLYSGLSELK